MKTEKPVWVRIAVNKNAWKNGDSRRWRIFIDPDPKPIYVKAVSISGNANPQNWQTSDFDKPDQRDVIAFIYVFGFISIVDDCAAVELVSAV